jgi:hypothetical protein
LISLYSYLLDEKAVREPTKKYLLVATLTESKSGKSSYDKKSFGLKGQSGDVSKFSGKLMKNIDKKMNTLTTRVDRTLKEIQERLDILGERQMKQ